MDIKKEREAFEAWYCRNHTGLKQSDLAEFRTLSGYSFSDSLKINVSWEAWQAAKAQAVQEGFVLVPKLSANYLFNKVPELGFKHRDEKDTVLYHLNYMASEFKESAKELVKKDHEKQIKFLEEEAQEQSYD